MLPRFSQPEGWPAAAFMAKYQKAPITEAVIDLQVRLPAEKQVRDLESLWQSAGEDERKRRLRESSFRFDIVAPAENSQGGAISSSTTETERGFSLKNKRRAVQWRLDGFSYSRIAPYGEWEDFQDEARSLWLKYRDVAAPEAITRVGLRYINQFNIPLPIRDFADFFRTVPMVSPDLPQALAGYFMQLQIPDEKLGAMLILNQAIVPPPQAGMVSVVLDIDIASGNNLPSDEGAIWALLERLRARKNEVFEACITDAARELIR